MKLLVKKILIFIFIISLYSCENNVYKRRPYQEELNAKINRGLVCFQKEDYSNVVIWRKLASDLKEQQYYLWAKDLSSVNSQIRKIAKTRKTHYFHTSIKHNKYSYGISLDENKHPDKFEKINRKINKDFSALSFDLGVDYKQAYVVTGDLTGDGEIEVLVNYSLNDRVDPFKDAWMKSTEPFILVAFTKYGEKLWEYNMGFGIESGRNYAPVLVWDLNGDGKCEVILKTNKSNDPLNYEQEYISVLNGENGRILRETRWPNPASDNYNSNSRNYIAIAHLDGTNPSIIVGRGVYHTQIICGFDVNLNKNWERIIGKDIKPKFENKILQKVWRRFSNDKFRGSHSLPIADVDENGTEEIFWGEHVLTQGGKDLWKVEEKTPYYGHPDIVYTANIIDSLPGKETYYCREGWKDKSDEIGVQFVDSKGNIIWSRWGYTHVDGGWAARIIPEKKDWQFFNYDVAKKNWVPGQHSFNEPNQQLLSSDSKILSNPDSSWIGSFTLDWEGDGIKEICTKAGKIMRYNSELLLSLKKGILWAGDLWGDHREEIVYAPQDGKVYIIFNTDGISIKPKVTKIVDRQYRNDLSRTAMQYNVIPTQSGYIPIDHLE